MCCCVLFYIYLFSVSACEKKSSSTNKEGKRICSQEYARKDEMNNKKDTIHSIFICCFSLFFYIFLFYLQQNKNEISKLQTQMAFFNNRTLNPQA